MPKSTSRGISGENSASGDPNEQIHHQQTSQQAHHVDSTPRPQSQENVKQDSTSSISHGGSVASYRKATEIKQKPAREQPQALREPLQPMKEPPQPQRELPQAQQTEPVIARPGMTVAQTIAAQATETFQDDVRSVCSSKSSGSMRTARCTSSTTSMHTAYDEGSGSVASQSSQQCSGSQQSRGQKKSSSGVFSSEAAAKKPMRKHPQLAPRQLNTHSNDSIQVAMSHIVHPSEFYVHIISPDIKKMDYMQEELRYTYEDQYKDKEFHGFVPDVGMMCVSKYSVDDTWYRIKVLTLEERTTPVLAGVRLK